MRLELKDLKSGAVYTVDDAGAVLGREPGSTDIQLQDDSISKRHARIFPRAGTWFVEDLGSSNGTKVYEQRINTPVELGLGVVVTLAQRRFEVCAIEGREATPRREAPSPPPPDLVVGPAGALARALGHFLAGGLRLPLDPAGYVRRSVSGDRLPALSPAELAVFGGVGGVWVGGLVGASVLVALAVAGVRPAADELLSAAVHAGVGLVVGAGLGAAASAVVDGVVRSLGGLASPRQRTNLAVDGATLAVLLATLAPLRPALRLLPDPFGELASILLAIYLASVAAYVGHTWAGAVAVRAGVKNGIVVLGGLAVVAGALRAVKIVAYDRPPGPPVATLEGDASAAERRTTETPTRAVAMASVGPGAPKRATDPGAPPPASKVEGESDAEPGPDPATPSSDPAAEVTPFQRYRARLARIEAAVEADPALVGRRDIREDYAELWRIRYEVEQRYQREGRKRPAWERDKILARAAAQECFERTRGHVDRIHRALDL